MQPDIAGPGPDGLIETPCKECGRTVILDAKVTAEFIAYANGPRQGKPVACNECFGYKLWSHPRKEA